MDLFELFNASLSQKEREREKKNAKFFDRD